MQWFSRNNRKAIAIKTMIGVVICAFAVALVWNLSSAAQTSADGTPAYSASGELIRPADYREWVYVSSGLGMTYGPAQAAAGQRQMFDNVFVRPEAYREFMRSGKWPEKTMFILEVRNADTNVSINNGGRTQGALVGMEASVKDRERFPDDGWGYFSFDSPQGPVKRAAPLPVTASCYSCHRTNTAVDNTFIQFYPTLFEVAKRLGTVKTTYEPTHK